MLNISGCLIEGIPPKLRAVAHHYKNMFELPVLFYLLDIELIITDETVKLDIQLAHGVL